MTTIVVLFNLKSAAAAADYERWARNVDVPTVRSLSSVERFEVLKSSGLLGGGASPFRYVEIIRIKDMAAFSAEIASAAMKKVAQDFQGFADQPLFLLTSEL